MYGRIFEDFLVYMQEKSELYFSCEMYDWKKVCFILKNNKI